MRIINYITLYLIFVGYSGFLNAEEIANSINDFSFDGTQGENGWVSGYRNYSQDGGGDDYDPNQDFIAFDQNEHWRGEGWRLVPSNAPWTTLNSEFGHPNGPNNGDEHWAIRRWESDRSGPLAFTWSLREQNDGGSGVGGSLHHNGVLVDSESTSDTNGFTRTYYLNIESGDVVDLALTPVGPSGDRADGADGSFFSMAVDDAVNDVETQPDGSTFLAASGDDDDEDGLPDNWEEIYAPGDLSALNGDGVADYDEDGLSDLQEYELRTNPDESDTDDDGLDDFAEVDEHSSDPTLADTDGDGLSDGDEVLASPSTSPILADTDGDGFDDKNELFFNSDPTKSDDTPFTFLIGDSVSEWNGGIQGQDNWTNGWRNVTADGGGDNYNPRTDFIPFNGGADDGGWNGVQQQWNGNAWDLNTAGAPPWTFLGSEATHPNGTNNGEEHHTVRRWEAASGEEIDTVTPVAIIWNMRKSNTNGDGVTGSVHHNGEMIDSLTIAGNDTEGSTRIVYANLSPGDFIDLAHSPIGTTGTNDGSDSSQNWMRIDTRIPDNPVQPDGSAFVSASGEDTDADGLPDAWELSIFEDDLSQLSGLDQADLDDDGLADIDEFSLGTAPNDPDSDEDGLKDGAEVSEYKTDPKSSDTDNDGITDGDEISGENGFVTLPNSADSDGDGLKDGDEVKNYSTDPLKTDTDGDGSDDGYEVNRFFDPLDASINPSTLLADSYDEFSGIQGQDDWQYGYRNLTLDGGDIESYDAENDFIAFDEQEHWRPGWRLAPSAAPWTLFNGPEGSHPNGTNSAPNEEHWTVRRWTADELTSETPIGLKWHTRKTNLNGTGVTGSLFVNGGMVDSASFAGNDGVGEIRTWYANLNPGDVVDLALTPVGPDGNSTDGSDGSANWLRVDTYIPIGAEQPDGSPFLAALKQGLQISDVFFDKSNKTIVVSWPSGNGRSYALDISSGLLDSIEDGSWEEYDDSIPGEDDETTYEVIIEDELPKRLFIRVRDITD